jgi:esterase/lipase
MGIKKVIGIFLSLVLIINFAACNKDTVEEETRIMTNAPVYDGVVLSKNLWQTPEYFYDTESDREDVNIKALYYKTYYKNQETYAFAYLGIPEGVSQDKKAPAVLLIHGGAGTAYWEWIKMWVDKGYIALAMDLEGHIPTENGIMTTIHTELYTKSIYDAPTNHNYDDSNLPLEETWMYYAVQTTILGNSLLHSLDCVNNDKIGVCGISWGGVITSIITGYDNRLAFSIPIYCSLNMNGTEGFVSSYYEKNPSALIWDDAKGLEKIETPICWVVSNVDSVCSIESINNCYKSVKNGQLVIHNDLLHSQYIAAALLEPYYFADSIVKNSKKPIIIKEQPSVDKQYCKISIPEGTSIDTVKLSYTCEDTITSTTNWGRRNCQISNDIITFNLDSSTTAYYITIEDNLGLKVSTKVILL